MGPLIMWPVYLRSLWSFVDEQCLYLKRLQCLWSFFDQMAAASAVIDDDSISFTCRMWYIFLREILLDRDVFQSIYAKILIANIVIRPWYEQDGNFPLAMREAFKWRIDYPEDQDRMIN
jgi:hypothetical protein